MRLVVALVGDAASDLDARAASARWCADAIDALDGVAACERAMRDGEDDDDDGCATSTSRRERRRRRRAARARPRRGVEDARAIRRARVGDRRSRARSRAMGGKRRRRATRASTRRRCGRRCETPGSNCRGENGAGEDAGDASAAAAAASACGAMEAMRIASEGRWVDVIWFAPSAAAGDDDFKRGRGVDDGNGRGVRRVSTREGALRDVRAVSRGAVRRGRGGRRWRGRWRTPRGASISNVGDDETVDLGERVARNVGVRVVERER